MTMTNEKDPVRINLSIIKNFRNKATHLVIPLYATKMHQFFSACILNYTYKLKQYLNEKIELNADFLTLAIPTNKTEYNILTEYGSYIEKDFIKTNDYLDKILNEIMTKKEAAIKYLKNNNKSTEYNIERRRKSGIYYFDNEGIAIFYQKEFNKKIVEKMCHNPAILFDIEDRGYLREGYYADLVLVDMNALWTVQKQNLLYKCGWSPLEGQQFHAKIVSTFVNGQLAYNNGQVCPTPYGKRVTFNR